MAVFALQHKVAAEGTADKAIRNQSKGSEP